MQYGSELGCLKSERSSLGDVNVSTQETTPGEATQRFTFCNYSTDVNNRESACRFVMTLSNLQNIDHRNSIVFPPT